MTTELIYLNDSYAKETECQIIAVEKEAPGYRIMLDRTIFYPIGGGQPTDQGVLSTSDWETFVYQALMKRGEVWHYIKTDKMPKIGLNVKASIDWSRRYKNMRVHSAGHVVDFAMYKLGFSPNKLMPVKGDHGKKPYIVYQGTAEQDFKAELEIASNDLIKQNLAFSTTFQPLESLKKEALYLQPGLPSDKPLRTLRLETLGAVADGGTQVKKTGEIGKISIPSIEQKNSQIIVHYRVSDDIF